MELNIMAAGAIHAGMTASAASGTASML